MTRRLSNPRSALYLFSFYAIVLGTWYGWIAPEFKKIPDNFVYSAEILSVDNFYNAALKKFQGEQISKTTFTYKTLLKKRNYLLIENLFSVSTLNNKTIFSASRLYSVNPYTGSHVPNVEKNKRQGFLFGPRYLNKQDFDYWHVNYDVPAKMHFIKEESLDGLNVYLYEAFFEADQTVNLSYLAGVPEKRGIKTYVDLKLWIEPISGWLVTYHDNAKAYFYDRATGKKLGVWNQFSNRYTENSIHQQVMNARHLKWKILAVDFYIPILFTLCMVFFGYIYNRRVSLSTKIAQQTILEQMPTIFLAILLVFFILEGIYVIFLYKKTSPQFNIGISAWNNNTEFNEIIAGFKNGLANYGYVDGQNVRFIIKNPADSIENQINIIQAFIKMKVNLIFTLTTPGTLVAKGITNKTPIVFSEVTYPEESTIIDTVKSSKNNLLGTRNYIPPAQQFFIIEQFYPHLKLIGFVRHKGEANSELQYAEYKKLLARRGIAMIDIAAVDLDHIRQLLPLQNNVNAFILACDTLIQGGGAEIIADYSKKHKIPTFSCDKNSVLKGALLGFVANPFTLGELAGKKAALILRGAEPTWLHTEAPQNGYLIINLNTANALGIKIPLAILQKANEIVK